MRHEEEGLVLLVLEEDGDFMDVAELRGFGAGKWSHSWPI